MNDKNAMLLPSGLYDLLPPDAAKESTAVAQLLKAFGMFGYEHVQPPLMEFESSLLSGRGESLASYTFRVMDPLTGHMMGVRSDMTMQVARIAQSRMAASPRPLRLCYAGQILQTRPDALQNERQLTQAGIELIGSEALQADSEVITVAAESLAQLGIRGVTVDINLPGLLGSLCPEAVNSAGIQADISSAVQQRDSARIRQMNLSNAAAIAELIETAGPAERSLKALEKLGRPEAAMLRTLVAQLKVNCPDTGFTIDPLEFRGFDYHQGISFSIFAAGLRHELGRGGRYTADGETATGFTLYVTHLLGLLPVMAADKRILLPKGTPPEAARRLRAEGWITVGALADNIKEEAKRLGIATVWQDGKTVSV